MTVLRRLGHYGPSAAALDRKGRTAVRGMAPDLHLEQLVA